MIIGIFLVIVFFGAIFNGYIASSEAVSAVHQIYVALYYLMAVIALAGAGVISTIYNLAKKFDNTDKILQRKAFVDLNKQILLLKTSCSDIKISYVKYFNPDGLEQLSSEIKEIIEGGNATELVSEFKLLCVYFIEVVKILDIKKNLIDEINNSVLK